MKVLWINTRYHNRSSSRSIRILQNTNTLVYQNHGLLIETPSLLIMSTVHDHRNTSQRRDQPVQRQIRPKISSSSLRIPSISPIGRTFGRKTLLSNQAERRLQARGDHASPLPAHQMWFVRSLSHTDALAR
jgi:hypothetical protein